MPCENPVHSHRWPRSGAQRFVIESCETKCDWCTHQSAKANNLRVHAHRHIKQDEGFKSLIIVPSSAGRRRVATHFLPSRDLVKGSPSSAESTLVTDDIGMDAQLGTSQNALQRSEEARQVAIEECRVLRVKNEKLERLLFATDHPAVDNVPVGIRRGYSRLSMATPNRPHTLSNISTSDMVLNLTFNEVSSPILITEKIELSAVTAGSAGLSNQPHTLSDSADGGKSEESTHEDDQQVFITLTKLIAYCSIHNVRKRGLVNLDDRIGDSEDQIIAERYDQASARHDIDVVIEYFNDPKQGVCHDKFRIALASAVFRLRRSMWKLTKKD